MLDNLQPPPRQELRKAWAKFFTFKHLVRRPLNSTQLIQCRRLLDYLSQQGLPESEHLNREQLTSALSLLSNKAQKLNRRQGSLDSAKVEFAFALFDAIDALDPLTANSNTHTDNGTCILLARVLCAHGAAMKAYELLPEFLQRVDKEPALALISIVAQGLSDSGNEKQFFDLISDAKERRQASAEWCQRLTIQFYADNDRVEETMALVNNKVTTFNAKVHEKIANFALRNRKEQWARDYFRTLSQAGPERHHWRAISIGQLQAGESLEGIQTAISTYLEMEPSQPTASVFNGLLTVARDRRDEELANAITALAADNGAAPDAYTFLTWLELKLALGNIEGAKFALQRLMHGVGEDYTNAGKSPEIAGQRERLENVLNDLLRLLTAQNRPDFAYITEILEYIDQQVLRLEPETASRLCLRFLENEQFMDAMDLLAIYAFKYGEDERQVLQTAFLSFCLDPTVSTARAWSAYQILEQYFPDLERPERIRLMDEFFRRKRSDMAAKVFGAMRVHRSPSYRPDESMYRRCFEGFAQVPDLESTQQVYNWLKTDNTVQPSTRLFTALMLAHTACGRSLTALDFWKEITTCKEGPGYTSISAVFWALEKRPNGAQMAREIWERIEKMDIDVPADVYGAYVGALAGSGHLVEAQRAILSMTSYVGSEPDAMT